MKTLDIQPTPNPNAVRISVDIELAPQSSPLHSGSHGDHPLIRSLVQRPAVTSVLLQGSEITIVFDPDKALDGREELKWLGETLRGFDPEVLTSYTIREAISHEDPTLILITDVLEDEILPYLQSHGGGVSVIGMDGQEVLLRYIGACGGCPMSLTGTRDAIEDVLRREIDPDLKVRFV